MTAKLKFLPVFMYLLSSTAMAGTYYDDWDSEVVPDQIKSTTLYYGSARCEFKVVMTSQDPNILKSDTIYITKSQATSNAWPTKTVYASYIDLSEGITTEKYAYACKAIEKLSSSYVKEEIISYKTQYTAIQPFPESTYYEYGSCRNSTRKGTIFIFLTNTSANNMKVYAAAYQSPHKN
ncbi:hypothetical protein [Shewanella surugensis]|uniref:Uncharacterized protein n=1 Tax=Shewanella surugensis TaxID=212020 RepID=A0ABT0LH38_9GAMM|nr:hypothetical protein [Shewanella surugensis]MCL1127021.1 hypothetical protein [Shewanella surugensis]